MAQEAVVRIVELKVRNFLFSSSSNHTNSYYAKKVPFLYVVKHDMAQSYFKIYNQNSFFRAKLLPNLLNNLQDCQKYLTQLNNIFKRCFRVPRI